MLEDQYHKVSCFDLFLVLNSINIHFTILIAVGLQVNDKKSMDVEKLQSGDYRTRYRVRFPVRVAIAGKLVYRNPEGPQCESLTTLRKS